MKIYLLLFIVAFVSFSCNRNIPKEVKNVLKLAGENKKELLKVIDHYQSPGDSLKLRAAYFLIGNMEDKYFYDDKSLAMFDTVMNFANEIFDPVEDNKYIGMFYEKCDKVKILFDSIYNHVYLPEKSHVKIIRDIHYVSAELLIENIDLSFYVWENMPWAKFLTFDQFCDYILPYKSLNEKPEKWRRILLDKYKWVIDSVNNKTDPVEACSVANSELHTWFRALAWFDKYPTSIKFSDLMKVKAGECRDYTNMGLLVMRAMGIPVAKIYSPQDGNRKGGRHSWNIILNTDGKKVIFQGAMEQPGYNNLNPPETNTKRAKIVQQTYRKQQGNLPSFEKDADIPPILNDNYYVDITDECIPASDVTVQLNSNNLAGKNVVICVFNNHDWVAVHWCKANSENKAVFTKMGREIAYIAMQYKNHEYIPVSYPFVIHKSGEAKLLKLNKSEKVTLRLERKYPLNQTKYNRLASMVGDKFQLSNDSNFTVAKTVYTVTTVPPNYGEDIAINETGKYRYCRYSNCDTTLAMIAEMKVFGIKSTGSETELNNRLIGPFKNKRGVGCKKLIDNNIETYAYSGNRSFWVGFDFGKPTKVTRIQYAPRNDVNHIVLGNLYELFYWDDQWISLGSQDAQKRYLEYGNAPRGALFLLRCLTEGKEERIFEYIDDQQVWW